LDKLNEGIYLNFVKQYKSDQEDLLRVGINVAAYQIGVLDKVTNIFYFSGKTNVDADHERCNRDYFSALKISPFNEINF